MGPKLKERLAQIVSMSKDDLARLRLDLVAAFDALDDSGHGSVDELTELAEAVEEAKREESQALRDRVHQDTLPGLEDSETTPEYGEPEGEPAPDAPAMPETVPTYGDPEAEPESEPDGDTEHTDQP